jgi:hypothetical protein
MSRPCPAPKSRTSRSWPAVVTGPPQGVGRVGLRRTCRPEKLESKSFSTNRSTGGDVGREVVTEVAMSETRRLGASLPNSTSACALKRAPGSTIAPGFRRKLPIRIVARRRRWWRRVVLPVLRRRQLHAERTGMVDELRVARVTEPAMLRPRPVARDQPPTLLMNAYHPTYPNTGMHLGGQNIVF